MSYKDLQSKPIKRLKPSADECVRGRCFLNDLKLSCNVYDEWFPFQMASSCEVCFRVFKLIVTKNIKVSSS